MRLHTFPHTEADARRSDRPPRARLCRYIDTAPVLGGRSLRFAPILSDRAMPDRPSDRAGRHSREWRMRAGQRRNAAAGNGPPSICRRDARRRRGILDVLNLDAFVAAIPATAQFARGGAPMNAPANLPRILLIDSNVYFVKRLSDALEHAGIRSRAERRRPLTRSPCSNGTRPPPSSAPRISARWALTKWLRFCAPIRRPQSIPLIAVGDWRRSGVDGSLSRRLRRLRRPSPAARRISPRTSRSFLVSRQDGFQPTQMLSTAETALSGSLSHLDLPGVMQMLGQAQQTGALHINAHDTDGIIFFEGGQIVHAECDSLFGDEAVTRNREDLPELPPRAFTNSFMAPPPRSAPCCARLPICSSTPCANSTRTSSKRRRIQSRRRKRSRREGVVMSEYRNPHGRRRSHSLFHRR